MIPQRVRVFEPDAFLQKLHCSLFDVRWPQPGCAQQLKTLLPSPTALWYHWCDSHILKPQLCLSSWPHAWDKKHFWKGYPGGHELNILPGKKCGFRTSQLYSPILLHQFNLWPLAPPRHSQDILEVYDLCNLHPRQRRHHRIITSSHLSWFLLITVINVIVLSTIGITLTLRGTQEGVSSSPKKWVTSKESFSSLSFGSILVTIMNGWWRSLPDLQRLISHLLSSSTQTCSSMNSSIVLESTYCSKHTVVGWRAQKGEKKGEFSVGICCVYK